MTDWKTIRIPKSEFDRHQERKETMRLTWAEYINSQAPELWDADEGDWEVQFDPDQQRVSPVNYDRIREIVREEVRDAGTAGRECC